MNETFINEVWCDIAGYEGKYQISNCGRIKSFPKFIKRAKGSYYTKEKVLKCTLDNYGYPCVNLYSNGNVRHTRVHILVAKAFIENANGYSDINHKDGNKTNNHIDNLEWCVHSYNIQHAYNLALTTNFGENHKDNKLTTLDVIWIREHYKKNSREFGSGAIARKFNVSDTLVRDIIHHKKWKHV